MSVTIAL